MQKRTEHAANGPKHAIFLWLFCLHCVCAYCAVCFYFNQPASTQHTNKPVRIKQLLYSTSKSESDYKEVTMRFAIVCSLFVGLLPRDQENDVHAKEEVIDFPSWSTQFGRIVSLYFLCFLLGLLLCAASRKLYMFCWRCWWWWWHNRKCHLLLWARWAMKMIRSVHTLIVIKGKVLCTFIVCSKGQLPEFGLLSMCAKGNIR